MMSQQHCFSFGVSSWAVQWEYNRNTAGKLSPVRWITSMNKTLPGLTKLRQRILHNAMENAMSQGPTHGLLRLLGSYTNSSHPNQGSSGVTNLLQSPGLKNYCCSCTHWKIQIRPPCSNSGANSVPPEWEWTSHQWMISDVQLGFLQAGRY